MGEREEAIIETKLGILIGDFKRFRDEQRDVNNEQRGVNKELTDHGSDENKVQAQILTTLKWHTIIGSFMMGMVMFLMYSKIGES